MLTTFFGEANTQISPSLCANAERGDSFDYLQNKRPSTPISPSLCANAKRTESLAQPVEPSIEPSCAGHAELGCGGGLTSQNDSAVQLLGLADSE